MAQRLATPGVYIEEKNAFPNSVAGIPTAVPAFVGYTEKTNRDGSSLINRPVRISSLAEYESYFGKGVKSTFNLEETTPEKGYDFTLDEKYYSVNHSSKSRFILYDSIRMFFANGGGACFIVTVGSYYKEGVKTVEGKKGEKPTTSKVQTANVIAKGALQGGIDSLVTTEEPTILVVPEAVMLEKADCYSVQQGMLSHGGNRMKNIFSLLDVHGGDQPRTYDNNDVINNFREGVGANYLAYGATYYPFVNTTITQKEEVSYKNIADLKVLETILSSEAKANYDAKKSEEVITEVKKMQEAKTDVTSLNQTLEAISPIFKKILGATRRKLNVLPPSAALAGAYTATDNNRGVWKAPANLSLAEVVSPAVNITHEDQEDLNVTISGKSINAIRSFVGEGTLVWGARTLDGNSQDWRYINVRRTMIFLEQSIKYAAKAYVYEANNAATWSLVNSMISSFLNNVWKQGGLAGASSADAYDVQVGLGSTMTSNDILDGIMRIQVKVAITRPAEFIVITFQQKMQES